MDGNKNVTVSVIVFRRMAEGMTDESYAQLLIDLEDSSNEALRVKQLLINHSAPREINGGGEPMVEAGLDES